jgi:replicative DNA helicase
MTDNSKLFSTESEEAILSIIIDSPEKLFESQNLSEEMFSSTPTKVLFVAIKELINSGYTPEPLLLEQKLKNDRLLETAGGSGYLSYIAAKGFDNNNFSKFEKIVIDSYKARQLLHLGSKLSGMVDDVPDIDSVVEYIRDKVDLLSRTSGGEKTISIKDAARDAWEDIQLRVQNPGIRGVPTGFSNLDSVLGGIMPGDLYIIASRTSHGKTSFMCNSIRNSGRAFGSSSLIFSKEMNKSQLMDRLIAIDSGVPLTDIKTGTMDNKQLKKVGESLGNLAKLKIFIDSSFTSDITYICNTIRKYHSIHEIDVIYIDYAQLVAERNRDATHELGRISRALKLLANDLGIGVYLISQVNRGVESRDNKRPVSADLRQSGNLEEDSDVILMLYRDEMYNSNSDFKGMIEVLVRKNRNGPQGRIYLDFDAETTKLSPAN